MIAAIDQHKKITTPTGASAGRAVNSSDKKVPPEPNAGRGLGVTLANVGNQAVEIGKDVAHKGVSAIADQAISGVEHKARHAVRASVLNPMATLYSSMNIFLPFGVGKNLFSAVVSRFFLPYYQQINPHTKITTEQIINALEHGHTDSIENELFHAFDQFINSNLKEEERAKYEAGDKLVVINAFKNLLTSQITTAREAGGIKKICNGIANWIPFVNKLPDAVKPWVGGIVGGYVGFRVLKFAWHMAKWAIGIGASVLGLRWLAAKFSGGGAPAGLPSMPTMPGMNNEEGAAPSGGGMMSKIMDGVSKAAQLAAQAQGGPVGPGGGIGQALMALGGGVGGGGGH